MKEGLSCEIVRDLLPNYNSLNFYYHYLLA